MDSSHGWIKDGFVKARSGLSDLKIKHDFDGTLSHSQCLTRYQTFKLIIWMIHYTLNLKFSHYLIGNHVSRKSSIASGVSI
jgi:hypothetical protein